MLQYVEAIALTTILPFYVLGRLATSFFTTERHKTWRTVCTHALFRFVAGHTAYVKSMLLRPTSDTYAKWTKNVGLSPTIEPLPDGAKLLWIGAKRVDKVLLYAHGGAYLFGCGPSFMQFFRYLQLELEKRDIHIGIVILAYRLVPEAVYPSQLIDANQALDGLLSAGVDPQNLVLAGDSAGGNLIVQIFSHILHPRPNIPESPRSQIPFLGALLISPWVCLAGDKSFEINDPYDLISARTYSSWGNTVLQHADTQFVDPVGFDAPKSWFEGIHKLVGKVLVVSGAKECMYTAHKRLFEDYLKTIHPDVDFAVTEGSRGVHDDMLFDFVIPGERTEDLSPTTAVIVDWCAGLFGR
ncbi:Alpha/Beta hydrolase protein [Armillaria novae-zelandiae]|uniref:Alpha/Beta hydrolase protein n=1 Tax=Armillaria novae-zelandiae TaxID=153914 RepID=A0AA39UA68_9AGAR|nr:Alpha/Beta hydrolase protein [Armillaria novae-zelandiae]